MAKVHQVVHRRGQRVHVLGVFGEHLKPGGGLRDALETVGGAGPFEAVSQSSQVVVPAIILNLEQFVGVPAELVSSPLNRLNFSDSSNFYLSQKEGSLIASKSAQFL